VIKSVLDVKDTTPLHKSASHDPIFDRSILILTPERALKLTASNKERHYLWLKALSFLAQSGQGPPHVPRLSPGPEATLGNGHNRRSSILPGPILPSTTTCISMSAPNRAEAHKRLDTADSTAPPNIYKAAGGRHQRKRSSTNPQISAATSSKENSTAASTVFARRASNTATYQAPNSGSIRPDLRPGDREGSDRSIGTVRMAAFVGKGRPEDHTSQGKRMGGSNTSNAMTGKGLFGESLEVDPFEEF
jgi:hypothetical protein